ncbi:MAG: toll/interleukin-1 receptor domain-containing protein [Lachnospiraceae bacterium]|nr:toll/interleukin-1 receptor domain-containing protein [Lachnospiraceae bacterium]
MALNESQKRERSDYLEKNLVITECSQRKPYAFISYSSDNWETVFKNVVVPLQQQYGLCAYADKAFDKVNDKWIVPMLRNIRGADVIVAFVSQSYIESYACFLELLTAVNNKKPIVFVSVEENLHLGDTTDQPDVERGVKTEIINQGSNIATNTNNTSNDLMRAMKSAYTSISTLLEQDALSRYDISDAFINFFRDASINKKSINDLKAIKRTISSVSKEVFDKSLASKTSDKEDFVTVESKETVLDVQGNEETEESLVKMPEPEPQYQQTQQTQHMQQSNTEVQKDKPQFINKLSSLVESFKESISQEHSYKPQSVSKLSSFANSIKEFIMWFATSIMILCCLTVFSTSFMAAVCFIVGGLIICPKIKIKMNFGPRFGIMFILFIIGMLTFGSSF